MLESKIVIAGGGHAGIEAASIISKMGLKSIIVTLDSSAISPINPPRASISLTR